MIEPYYEDDSVALFHGDCRELLPALGPLPFDLAVADPPYGDTSLEWDRWPAGWPAAVLATGVKSLWCFGSMRMFLATTPEFAGWKYAQDAVWKKQNGSGFAKDRFRRVHEHAVQFYPDGVKWSDVYRAEVRVPGAVRENARIKQRTGPAQCAAIGPAGYEYGDTRLATTVFEVANCHGYAENETQKPEGIVEPLILASCPPGGLVLSPFAGSGTDLAVAKRLGRKAIGFETREQQCLIAAKRLAAVVAPEAT